MALVGLLIASFFLLEQPSVHSQSQGVTNFSLTFHGYSIVLKDQNGSFLVYDGADGAAPTSQNPTQANLISQISGQQIVYGMSVDYWSAVIIWAIKLPMDLHVYGTVNVKAYISSNFAISGLFSGSGYGMGIVDIDENNNEVQEFVTQAPYSIGRNAFTSTPIPYNVSTYVDYTFKAGHSIGLAVGLGATVQGFSATVYFDSLAFRSGATLPVVETVQSRSYNINSQVVGVVSNSVISDFKYSAASTSIQFTTQGINYTEGYCNVSIPKDLMNPPFVVTQGSQRLDSTFTENSSYNELQFTNTRSATPVQIAGNPVISPSAQPTITSSSPDTSSNMSPSPTSSPPISEYIAMSVLAILAVAALSAFVLKKRTFSGAKNN